MKHVNKSFFLDFPLLHFKVFVKTKDKTKNLEYLEKINTVTINSSNT